MVYANDRKQIKPNKKISRRKFLKYTGTIIFVAGTGCNVPLRRDQIEIPPSNGYLLVDVKKCQGCISCMLACTLVHEGVENPSLSRIQIIQNPFDAFPEDVTIEQCRQCVEPACVSACPADALRAEAAYGNVRMIDRAKCIGCGDCIEACPYTPSRPVVVPDEEFDADLKGRKCDLCANTPYHWDPGGGGPHGMQACVEVCPVGAIAFSTKIPIQQSETGYKINLRTYNWRKLGYPTD